MSRNARIMRRSKGLNNLFFVRGLATGSAVANVGWLVFLIFLDHRRLAIAMIALTIIPAILTLSLVSMHYRKRGGNERATGLYH